MDIVPVFLAALAAIVIAGIWFAGTRLRAKAEVAYGAQYRTVAEQSSKSQTELVRHLDAIKEQMKGLNQRVGEVERILKDAE
jgi:Tfp pilus assembly protein PilO